MLLLELPQELVEQILIELHPTETALLRQICRGLRALIDASIELQLRIELAVDGFLLGHRGVLVASELLDLVLERRRAFEEFRPQSWWTIPIDQTADKRFEVAEGVWAYTRITMADTTFRDIDFEELTPPDCKGGRWELSRHDIGVTAVDLSFWLNADVLYVLEQRDNRNVWRLHFRQLSTNEYHPLAAKPFVDFSRNGRDIWENCELIAYEERLSVEFYDSGAAGCKRTAAIILDWTSGEVLLPYTVVSDLAFLTKDLIALARSPADAKDAFILEVWSLSNASVLFCCKMPFPSDNFGMRFLKRPSSNHGAQCPTVFAKLFVPDPKVSILVAIVRPKGQFVPMGSRTTVVISISKFLRKGHELLANSKSNPLETHSKEDAAVRYFEWQEWGPMVTRWLPNDVQGHYGSRMVYGTKMLAVYTRHPGGPGRAEHVTMLLDFNPRAIRSDSQDIDDEYFSLNFQDQESESHGLRTSVKSSLPYRAWVSKVKSGYLNLFLDANTIVGRLPNSYDCFSFLPQSAVGVRELPPRKL